MSDLARTAGCVVRARGLGFRYGKGINAVDALGGVDLDIHEGELLMVRGPSGSGKTTLLQLIGGLLSPTSGTLSVLGTDLAGLTPDGRRALRLASVGFVFQSYNLFPTLKAWENVAIALDISRWERKRGEERARQLLEDFGLAARANFYPAELSGGQRQRVAIARALAHDPALILCDEPTASLDRQSGAVVTDELRRLAHAQRRCVVVVSHDSRLEPFVDRIVTIEDGVLVPDVLAVGVS